MTNLVDLLGQDRVWREPDGRTLYVGELTGGRLGEALAFLNRHAPELLASRRAAVGHERPPRPAQHVAWLESVDPLEWLHGMPLYRRLLAEQRRRASTHRPTLDEAMSRIDDEYGDALRQLGDA